MTLHELKPLLKGWLSEGYDEGDLSIDPEWYVLWKPDELEKINKEYEIEKYAPCYITFSGNGGGDLLAVNAIGEVFCLPAIGMNPDTANKIADNLNEFKTFMSK